MTYYDPETKENMICLRCIEKSERLASALQLFFRTCPECGRVSVTVAYPIEKKERA